MVTPLISPQERPPHLALIPYTIIESLKKFENIYEIRLFGWLLAKAQCTLKLYNKDLGEISLQAAMGLVRVTFPARYLLSPGDNGNMRQCRKAFGLATKCIDYQYGTHVLHLNIIAYPELFKQGNTVMFTCVMHHHLWIALREFSKGYRLINIPTFLRLRSPYSIIFYLLVSQQTKTIVYTSDQLKELCGCADKPAYNRLSNFTMKVVRSAQEELDEKSPYSFSYEIVHTRRGGSSAVYYLHPRPNSGAADQENDAILNGAVEGMRSTLATEVTNALTEKFDLHYTDIERYERLLHGLGDMQQQLQFICDIHERSLRREVTNPAGYFVNALKQKL